MKTLYIDSVGGLAGDMFLAAALDAGLATLDELSDLVSRWLPERVRLESETVTRNEMRARTFRVLVVKETSHEHGDVHGHEHGLSHEHVHAHVHEHRSLADVERLLDACPMPPAAIALAKTMFRELAAAEAVAHGIPEESVQFHEVGATDSLVDFALAAFIVERLGARIEASPAVLGRGRVPMAHGDWPVPPPGTAEILRRGAIPTRALPESFAWDNAELTTPTGACLLRLASTYGPVPAGVIRAAGVGAGTLDIPRWPNVTRLFVLETSEAAPVEAPAGTLASARFDSDTVAVLETWIDDTPGNVLALAVEEMLRAGALDVAVSSATFKKGRVGYRVEVLAPPAKAEAISALLLGQTTAIGLRIRESARWKLYRRQDATSDGIPAKLACDATGAITRVAPETDALAERAKDGGTPPLFGWRVEDRSKS
jgi:uncharacterized protein (TIGR00299 family) protein